MWPFRCKKQKGERLMERVIVGLIIGGAIGSIVGKKLLEKDEEDAAEKDHHTKSREKEGSEPKWEQRDV